MWAAVAAGLLSFPAVAEDAAVTSTAPDTPVAEAPKEVHIPVSATLVPGISTNGLSSGNVVNNFSFGLVATHAGRVDGLALATVGNWVDREVRGAQLAGAANVAGGKVTGAQVSGAVNVAAHDLTGWQVTGGANVASGDVRGWQVSGGVNVAKGEVHGAQITGGVSYADKLAGAQISVLNIGGDVDGAQVGVVNIARKVRGLQLGVLNISSEMEGAPIGVLSLVGNGQFHVQAYASDIALTNVALKLGSKHVYSIVTVGHQPGDAKSRRWLTGLGIGGHIPLGRFYVDIDGITSSGGLDVFGSRDELLLSQLRLIGGFQVAPRFSVFGGVTGNVLVEWENRSGDKLGLDAAPRWEEQNSHNTVSIWPGLVAGIQI